MKQNLLKFIGAGTLGSLILIALASTSVFGQGKGARALEGSWDSQVSFTVCATGNVIRTFPAMNTFATGGTMQEYGVGSAPAPRGPGHGVWKHVSERTFTSTFQFFRFSADGNYIGKAIGYRMMEVGDSGNTYTSTNTTDFYDTLGNFMFTGCAVEAGSRLEK